MCVHSREEGDEGEYAKKRTPQNSQIKDSISTSYLVKIQDSQVSHLQAGSLECKKSGCSSLTTYCLRQFYDQKYIRIKVPEKST